MMSERLNFEQAYNQARAMQFMMYDDVLEAYQGGGSRLFEYDYDKEDCDPGQISLGSIDKPYTEEMLQARAPETFKNYDHYSKEYDAAKEDWETVGKASGIDQLQDRTVRYLPFIDSNYVQGSQEDERQLPPIRWLDDRLSYDIATTAVAPDQAVKLLSRHVVVDLPDAWDRTRWSQMALERAANNPMVNLTQETIDQLCLISNYDENRARSDSQDAGYFTENYFWLSDFPIQDKLEEIYDLDALVEEGRVVLNDPSISAQEVAEFERHYAKVEQNATKHYEYQERRLKEGTHQKLARVVRTLLNGQDPQESAAKLLQLDSKEKSASNDRQLFSDFNPLTPFQLTDFNGWELLATPCRGGFNNIVVVPPETAVRLRGFHGGHLPPSKEWAVCEYQQHNGQINATLPVSFVDLYKAPELDQHKEFLRKSFAADVRRSLSRADYYRHTQQTDTLNGLEAKLEYARLKNQWQEASGLDELIDERTGFDLFKPEQWIDYFDESRKQYKEDLASGRIVEIYLEEDDS